jgi:hypothetical protein
MIENLSQKNSIIFKQFFINKLNQFDLLLLRKQREIFVKEIKSIKILMLGKDLWLRHLEPIIKCLKNEVLVVFDLRVLSLDKSDETFHVNIELS